MPEKIEYLGDGLYVSFDGYQVKLMANNHEHPTDTVYLNSATAEALLEYLKRLGMTCP